MKKLIIAATIVCVAAVSQAASVAWSSNNKSLADANGDIIRSASELANIVLVNLGSTADFSSVTTANIIPTGTASGQNNMTINTATNSKGGRLTGVVTFNYDATDTSSNLINNGDYLALMAYDGENLTQLKYVADDSDVSATLQVSGLANNGSTVSQKAIGLTGNFYAAAVPEPTSAMLVLLGVAGLALRRRRA